MAETIRDVVIKVRIQQEDTKLKVPDLNKPIKAIEEMDRKFKETRDNIRRGFKDIEDTSEGSSRVLVENSVEVADHLKQAGDGAFTLARGIAFVSASSEDDLRKMVENVAKVQGAFDLFRGGVDTVRGFVDAARKAGGAAGLLALAFNPVTAAAAAVAATIGAVVLAFKAFGDDSSNSIAKTKEELDELRQEEERLAETIRATGRARNEARGRGIERFVRNVDDRGLGVRGQAIALREERRGLLSEIERRRREQQEQASADVRNRDIGGGAFFTRRLADNEELLNLEQQRKRILEAEQELAAGVAEKEKERLRTQKQQLTIQKQQLQQEQGRLKTIEEVVGRLSRSEFTEFRGLAKRARSGRASFEELRRLEQLGGGVAEIEEFTSERFRERGRERGALGIVGGVGGVDLIERRRQIQEDLKTINESTRQVTSTMQEVARAYDRQARQQQRIMGGILSRIEGLQDEQARLEALLTEAQVNSNR